MSGSAVERGPLIDAGSSLRDVITDFTVGVDRIDVSLIDANENVAGNQAFTFRATGNFSGAGSIVYRQFDNAGTANDHTVVYFDTTGRWPLRHADRAERPESADGGGLHP